MLVWQCLTCLVLLLWRRRCITGGSLMEKLQYLLKKEAGQEEQGGEGASKAVEGA